MLVALLPFYSLVLILGVLRATFRFKVRTHHQATCIAPTWLPSLSPTPLFLLVGVSSDYSLFEKQSIFLYEVMGYWTRLLYEHSKCVMIDITMLPQGPIFPLWNTCYPSSLMQPPSLGETVTQAGSSQDRIHLAIVISPEVNVRPSKAS